MFGLPGEAVLIALRIILGLPPGVRPQLSVSLHVRERGNNESRHGTETQFTHRQP